MRTTNQRTNDEGVFQFYPLAQEYTASVSHCPAALMSLSHEQHIAVILDTNTMLQPGVVFTAPCPPIHQVPTVERFLCQRTTLSLRIESVEF